MSCCFNKNTTASFSWEGKPQKENVILCAQKKTQTNDLTWIYNYSVRILLQRQLWHAHAYQI